MSPEEHLQRLRRMRLDISDHLPLLQRYATGCESVVELGVRGIVSTWAFLAAKPKRLLSVDLADPAKFGGDLAEVYQAARDAGVQFTFLQANDLEIDLEPPIDLLFIDTWHVYEQLKSELARHSHAVRGHILLHDTHTFGRRGETAGHAGLLKAVHEFITTQPWRLAEHRRNCNGLTVLKRK